MSFLRGFLNSQSSSESRKVCCANAEHGNPQWDEALLPISVEEVTDTLQIVIYRGDLQKYGHVADGSLERVLARGELLARARPRGAKSGSPGGS